MPNYYGAFEMIWGKSVRTLRELSLSPYHDSVRSGKVIEFKYIGAVLFKHESMEERVKERSASLFMTKIGWQIRLGIMESWGELNWINRGYRVSEYRGMYSLSPFFTTYSMECVAAITASVSLSGLVLVTSGICNWLGSLCVGVPQTSINENN